MTARTLVLMTILAALGCGPAPAMAPPQAAPTAAASAGTTSPVRSPGMPMSDTTRWLAVAADSLRPLVLELLGAYDRPARSPAELADRMERTLRHLGPGDGATFGVPIWADSAVRRITVALRADVQPWVQVRGPAALIAPAAAVLHRRWMRSLQPVDGPLLVSVRSVPGDGTAAGDPVGVGGVGVVVALTTRNEYPCTGYGVAAEVERSPDGLAVTVLGIEPPHGLCGPILSPASWRSQPLELEAGLYTLTIRYRGAMDRYRLRVEANGTTTLRALDTDFTRLGG